MTSLKVEHIEDFTAHDWCNKLLSDPSITSISKRYIPDKLEGVSNTFFTRTLFTEGAIRAFLSMHRPGNGQQRDTNRDTVFVGSSPLHAQSPSNPDIEAQRQRDKKNIIYDHNAPDAAEALMLVSVGEDVDGGIKRLHGGVTATLLDQAMGSMVSFTYNNISSTSEMTVKYLKPVTTPCILLGRAKIIREKGRWVETIASLEDGHGKVYAQASGAFVLGKVGAAKI